MAEVSESSTERGGAQRRRAWLAALVFVGVAAVLAGVVAWVLLTRDAQVDRAALTVFGLRPPLVPVTTATVEPTSSAPTTGAPSAEASPSVVATPAVPHPRGRTLVAYRRGGWLCVAAPDGTDERRLVRLDSGVFALSPDASTMALVDQRRQLLELVDVPSGGVRTVGPVLSDRPAWSPDGGWLAYAAPERTEAVIRTVARDGSGARTVMRGRMPAVSFRGEVLGLVEGESAVFVAHRGRVRRLPTAGTPEVVVSDGARVYYAVHEAASGLAQVRVMRADGSRDTVLSEATANPRPVSYQDLCLSYDGAYIAYAEAGDDGYARSYILRLTDRRITPIARWRDTYPLCFLRDGRLAFIEGNALQGEPTRLVVVAPDGSGRTVIVDGATR